MRFDSPLLVRLAGRGCGTGFRLLFGTLRKELRTSVGASPYDASGPRRFLYSVWHDSAVLAAFGGHHTRTVALTSRHRDGAFVASVVSAVGVGTVRGSSGRSGRAAARELLEVAKTHDIVMTPDGPRGPRRQMSRGIVYLASRSGNEIVPTAFACENAWEVPGSWTTQSIPKPFSRVALVSGSPIYVPDDIGPSEIERYRMQIQEAMEAMQETADALIRRNTPSVLPRATGTVASILPPVTTDCR